MAIQSRLKRKNPELGTFSKVPGTPPYDKFKISGEPFHIPEVEDDSTRG